MLTLTQLVSGIGIALLIFDAVNFWDGYAGVQRNIDRTRSRIRIGPPARTAAMVKLAVGTGELLLGSTGLMIA